MLDKEYVSDKVKELLQVGYCPCSSLSFLTLALGQIIIPVFRVTRQIPVFRADLG